MGRGAGIGHAIWMFGLPLTDEPDQRVEVVSAGGKEIASPLTDLVYENVHEHWSAVPAHTSSSSHSISGVTTCGVRSPRRRLITVRCAILFGLARWRMFHVMRKSNS